MTTRKFGLLGLTLGMVFLAACEPKSETIVVPPVTDTTPTISLNLVPEAATINVASTVTLVPVVTGTTNQAVTFTSSNTSIATVNASGVVTGVAAGSAVITAVSTADPRARDASVITVIVPPTPPAPTAPTINIASMTQGGTLFPVNTSNVSGQVDVTVNADIPVGSNVTSLRVSLVSSAGAATEVCRQTFTGTGEIEVNSQVPVQIVCSINTADFDPATGAPRFPNGVYNIRAELLNATGGVAASATSQPLTLNNTSFIALRSIEASFFEPGTTTARACVNAGTNPRSLAGAGSRWCGGDLTINLTPVIFGTVGGTLANDRVASVTVALTTSGVGVNGMSNCDNSNDALISGAVAPEDKQVAQGAAAVPLPPAVGGTLLEDGTPRTGVGPGLFGAVQTDADGDGFVDFPGCPSITVTRADTDASNGLSVTFSAASAPDATTPGILEIEDIVGITVNSVTVGGQAGPVCINPDPRLNALPSGLTPGGGCGTGAFGFSGPNVAFFPNPLRIDNFAPRITEFDLTPTGCLTGGTAGGCFVNGTFSFAPRAGFFRAVDYGSDSQNANTVFSASTSATGTFTTVTTGADLAPGSVTANDLFIRVVVRDGIGNTTTRFPASCAAAPCSDAITTTSTGTGASIAGQPNQFRFGVDLQAPVIDATLTVQPTPNGANDGTTFAIAFRDEGIGPSGFTGLPVWVKVERITTAGTTCRNAETGAVVAGSSGSGCDGGTNEDGFVETDGTFTTPAATEGYYRFTYYVQDAAGNRSAQVVVLTLIDVTAPTVAGIVAPSVITGNAGVTFTATTTDNVDLGDVQPTVSYTTVGRFLQENTTPIGTYGPPLETTATASATIANFIRSLETTTAAGAPTGAIDRADAIAFNVRDQAGVVDNVPCPGTGAPNTSTANCTNRTDPITANVDAGIPAGTTGSGERSFSNVNIGVATFTLAQNNATVCNSTGTGAGQPCPTNPSTTTLTATATGPTATFPTPFVRVNFYYVDPATGRSVLIGSAAAPSVTDVGGVRSYIYTTTWNPANLPAGAREVFAVGVHATGMGLQSPSVVTTIAVD